MRARWLLVVPLGLGVGAMVWAARPPRPDLPLPVGFFMTHVEGHCVEGSETFMCAPGEGPRSTLTIGFASTPESAWPRVLQSLYDHHWTAVNGRMCREHQGCVVLHGTLSGNRLLLDWYETDKTACAGPGDLRLDPVDCDKRPTAGPSSMRRSVISGSPSRQQQSTHPLPG
jgi:hypothetical protein